MSAVGLYGKIPAERDFVRIGAGAFCSLGVDQWFQEGIEGLKKEGTRLPDEPICFVLTLPGSDSAFVGAFAPSEDAVGRLFPLIAFSQIPVAQAARSFSVLPIACQEFYGALTAFLGPARQLNVEQLTAQVTALEPPGTGPDAAAMAERILEHTETAELHPSLGTTMEGPAYALRTLVSACEQASKTPPGKPASVTIDAPLPSEAAAVLWLELLRRRFAGSSVVPSAFWTAPGMVPAEGRLLATLGPAPASVLPYAANRAHPSSRLWPLRTHMPEAVAGALAALTSAQKTAVETGATLASLLQAFSS